MPLMSLLFAFYKYLNRDRRLNELCDWVLVVTLAGIIFKKGNAKLSFE